MMMSDDSMKLEQPQDQTNGVGQRILVIDDEAHIVQVLSLKLRNAGYEVLTASDGEEGFEIALKHLPSVIITDYQMPYMTGLELCRELAANAATARIPVLMLTARGYALEADDLSIGDPPIIRDVLSKPFSPRAIVDQIHRILQGNAGHGEQAMGNKTIAHSPLPIAPSSRFPRTEVV